ncbi:DUF1566 domain-containing protein [Coprobacter tertius]|uniref:DUF1566 domain-containing protein n=1 Tax=Coprobacter tertius TaxID=2944915 RepID=A0ABT1MPA6_9BACT|nr:DUF1566 domain-containing protein [Coprobacter tertius]MCP9613116.1 DUF1566 domain-containing protein [Coprobacter tertius]
MKEFIQMKKMKRFAQFYRVGLCGTGMWLCLFTDMAAQYVCKEVIADFNAPVAVIYTNGMPESAIWPLGTVLTKNGATIRHREREGNMGNRNINSRVSARFIVAPDDLSGTPTWAEASGFEDNGNKDNLNADFVNPSTGGCRGLTTGGRHWRLPTERELQLMWVLMDGINIIYPNAPLSGSRFASTESAFGDGGPGRMAIYVDFYNNPFVLNNDHPFTTSARSKIDRIKSRCISDY